jgi:hypothetical protein
MALDVVKLYVLQAKIPDVEMIAVGMVRSIVREVNAHVGNMP